MLKGGEFLIKQTDADAVFIREEFAEEQLMMFQATRDFLETEVMPYIREFEKPNYALTESLMKKAGELGLLGISVPESLGGLGMGFNTSMLICEEISSVTGSLATAYGAHTGIGTLPILLYGSDAIKAKYLPKVASGEWMSCYNLTEPDAGSDANAGKTKAVLTPDGTHYEITGQKIWISNAGFADVFIVFARIEDDKNITGFVFHKDEVTGLTLGDEEHKMGIKSSSTRQVFYDKVKVPVTNILGKRGDGFKIAVNALNAGRIKLNAAVNGAMVKVINLAVQYANERKQFGKPIAQFGAIKQKIAEMAMRAYVNDAGLYRAGDLIEQNTQRLLAEGLPDSEAKLKGIEEYAIECAILKVHGSDLMAFIADQGVQIFGGMGFSADAPMDAAYRDARISRIYEGTNEINSMLIVNMLLKKALTGKLDLMRPAMAVAQELMAIPDFGSLELDSLLAEEKKTLENFKKTFLLVAGAGVQKLGEKLADEQELLIEVAKIAMEIWAFESTILKTEKLIRKNGATNHQNHLVACTLYMHYATDIISKAAKEAIYAITEGDEQRMMLLGVKRFTKLQPANLKDLRRKLADSIIENNAYNL